MGSVTKTYVENEYSSNKSTWTVTITGGAPQTVSSNFRLTPVTVTAKYVGSNKGYAQACASLDYYADGVPIKAYLNSESDWAWFHTDHQLYPADPQAWASNVTKTLPLLDDEYSFWPMAILSSIFNDSNKTVRTVSISVATDSEGYDGFNLESTNANLSTDNYYISTRMDTFEDMSSVTLNAPPTIEAGTPSYPSPHYVGISSYSVPISSAAAQYGGDIVSIKLSVGTDSTTKTYSENTKTISLADEEIISVVPNNAGTYTPTLEITDSRNQKTIMRLPSIVVDPYTAPSFNFDVYRTNSIGIKDDEGTYGLIATAINFMDTISNLTSPIITIDGQLISDLYFLSKDTTVNLQKIYYIRSVSEPYTYTQVQNPSGNPVLQEYYEKSNITWYTSLLSSTAVDTSTKIDDINITWSDISSGDTIYGLIDNSFSTTTSYSIGMSVKDTSDSSSIVITQILSTAFYTIDFQAGGKEIAFGLPANDTLTTNQQDIGLFKCGMESRFESITQFNDDITATQNITTSNIIVTNLIGEIKMWAGNTIPNGWLECDGHEELISDYPLLAAALGADDPANTTPIWGIPSDNDYFVLPNLSGRVPVGYDSSQTEFDTIGETGGAKSVTLNSAQSALPNHTHPTNSSTSPYFLVANANIAVNGTSRSFPSSTSSGHHFVYSDSSSAGIDELSTTGARTQANASAAHTNLQPYAVVKYIICAA